MAFERGFIVPSVEALVSEIDQLRRSQCADPARIEPLHRHCSRKLRHYPLDKYIARFAEGPDRLAARERWEVLRAFVAHGANGWPDPPKQRAGRAQG